MDRCVQVIDGVGLSRAIGPLAQSNNKREEERKEEEEGAYSNYDDVMWCDGSGRRAQEKENGSRRSKSYSNDGLRFGSLSRPQQRATHSIRDATLPVKFTAHASDQRSWETHER